MDREKVIKAYEDFVNGYECFCTSDDYEYEMHKAVLALLKEQDELLRKLQKDKDNLCLEVSKWKHRFHERPLKEKEAVKPILDEQMGRLWLCGECGSYVGFEDNDPHDPNEFDKYCRDCGTPVLWEGR